MNARLSDPYRTVAVLDVASYLENSNSLRGNTYKITGTILNSLGWAPNTGRLFSVEVGIDSTSCVLPVFIPTQFGSVNVQKGQRFFFKVKVDENGILKVEDLQKV